MEKIIKVTADEVVIYDNNYKDYLKVHPMDCTFSPKVGDFVEVHYVDGDYIINKFEGQPPKEETVSVFYDGALVNKWFYILLAIFFGLFGAHHFYAGYQRKGWWTLAFCWAGIPIYIGLYHAFVAMTKTPDRNGNIVI